MLLDQVDVRGAQTLAFEKLDGEMALAALSAVADGVLCTDAGLNVVFMNAAAQQLVGRTMAEIEGQPVKQVLTLYDEQPGLAAFDPAALSIAQDAPIIRESGLLLRSFDGSAYDIGLSAAPIRRRDGALAGAVILFNNVTQIRAYERKLAHSALHDPLTGLPNRASFISSLETAMVEARERNCRYALGFLDLDRFKDVNNRGGHAAGDAVLADVAKLLTRGCGSRHTVARLGGDEFALIIREASFSDAAALAKTLVAGIKSTLYRYDGQVYRIGASAGLTSIDANAPLLVDLLHEADKACYAAKESGRNRVCVYGGKHRTAASLAGPYAA